MEVVLLTFVAGICTLDEWLKSHISQNDDCTSWVQVQEPSRVEWTHKLDMTSRELSSVVDW